MEKEQNIICPFREVWFDGRQLDLAQQDIWSLVSNSSIDKVLVTAAQRNNVNYSLKTEFITQVDAKEQLECVKEGDIILSQSQELLDLAIKQGFKTCIFFPVEGRAALDLSWQVAMKYDYMLVDFDLPTNIPLELIIARLQDSKTTLLKQVNSYEEMEVIFGVMEKGSDGVLLSTQDSQEIVKVSNFLANRSNFQMELKTLTVEKVQHAGMGLRACIDTIGIMGQDEGMIIGSTSAGGIFVCSETHYLPYMNLRPFRVNAGAIHSYVWMPNNTVEYITDLAAGCKVICVNTKGQARILTIGRMKIEKRPLLLLKGKVDEAEINVFVQDDWHIRIMGADGKPKNATQILPGDTLMAYTCEPGRHVGIKVDETIIER